MRQGPEQSQPANDKLAERLVEYDAALAAGSPPQPAASDEMPPEVRDAISCLDMLERVRLHDSDSADYDPEAAPTPREISLSDAPTKCVPPATRREVRVPARLGRFEIQRILGQGGCGVVFLAKDPVLNRLVALKIPRPEALLTPEVRQRFLREGRAAGCLDHPNLLPVFEAGEIGAICYLASAYCPGITLRDWLRQNGNSVSPRAAAELVATLADAMHYAHQRGVCHRDLKPSNVLLQIADIRLPIGGNPTSDTSCQSEICNLQSAISKIIDFGLAKVLHGDSADPATRAGAVFGTPQYMAPEQAQGKTEQVGPATDIHALGVVLYEMLTGAVPYQGESDLEILRQVIDVEPPRLGRLRRQVPRDLETVCLKCLEKDPQRRYASMRELADDLKRFLDGRAIQARPMTLWERGWKGLRRRPRLAIAASVGVLALAALMGVRWYVAAVQDSAAVLSAAADTARQERDRVEAAAHAARKRLYARDIAALAEAATEAGLTANQLSALGPEELRGFEWHYLCRLADTDRAGTERFVGRGHTRPVVRVAFSPDGRACASAGVDGRIIVWDLATHGQRWVARHKQPVTAVAFSPDGKSLASASRSTPELKLWDAATGTEQTSFAVPGQRINSLAFTPDGQTLALCGDAQGDRSGKVLLLDLRAGRARGLASPAAWYAALALSPDGQVLAVGCGHGQGRYPGNAGAPRWGAIRLFETASGKSTAMLTGHPAVVQWVAFAPDGKTLVSADVAGTVKVWDLSSGRARLSFQAGTHLALSRDGTTLAAVLGGRELQLWDVATGRRRARVGGVPSVHCVQFGPSRTQLAAACEDGTMRLFDTGPLHDLPGHRPAEAWAVAFTPNGKTLASAGDDHNIRLWSVPGFTLQTVLRGHTGLVASVAFSSDGRTLASGSFDHTVQLWDATTGRSQTVLRGHTQDIRAVVFSRDGRLLATAAKSVRKAAGELKLWDLLTGKERTTLAAHGTCVAFSADGRLLAFRDDRDSVRLLEVSTLRPTHVLRDSTSVTSVTFTPDGKTLATADAQGVVKLWNVQTGAELDGRRAHAGSDVRALAFSADGKVMGTAGMDKTIRLWQAATGCELLRFKNLPDHAHGLAFSPDGTILAAAFHDGTVRLYQSRRDR